MAHQARQAFFGGLRCGGHGHDQAVAAGQAGQQAGVGGAQRAEQAHAQAAGGGLEAGLQRGRQAQVFAGAGQVARGAARTVGGQIQRGPVGAQRALPVRQVLRMRLRCGVPRLQGAEEADPLATGQGVVRPGAAVVRVGGGQVFDQHAVRPAVEHQVVGRQQQCMAPGRAGEQHSAEQGALRQGHGLAHQVGRLRLHRGVKAGRVGGVNGQALQPRQRARLQLPRQPQRRHGVVVAQHLVQRGAQGDLVQGACQAELAHLVPGQVGQRALPRHPRDEPLRGGGRRGAATRPALRCRLPICHGSRPLQSKPGLPSRRGLVAMLAQPLEGALLQAQRPVKTSRPSQGSCPHAVRIRRGQRRRSAIGSPSPHRPGRCPGPVECPRATREQHHHRRAEQEAAHFVTLLQRDGCVAIAPLAQPARPGWVDHAMPHRGHAAHDGGPHQHHGEGPVQPLKQTDHALRCGRTGRARPAPWWG